MKPATVEPRMAADDIGIRFMAIGSGWGDYPGVEWGEIHQVCALWNKSRDNPPWLEIYVDHFSGVDFRFSSVGKGYDQVMKAIEEHLVGFSRARAEAVGSWEEEQDLPVVWRRDLVAQPFELRLPQVDPRDPTPVEPHVIECVRNATIGICAMCLGRELEAEELHCIQANLIEGRIRGSITCPLSETLTRSQDQLNGKGKLG